MPYYAYTARAGDGQMVSAALHAGSRQEAVRLLTGRGLRPVTLREAGDAAAKRPVLGWSLRGSRQLDATLQLPFLQALGRLTASGLPAGEAVRLLSLRLQEERLRRLCRTIWERLSEGLPLSEAMLTVPEVFSVQTANLVAAGEATGSLGEVVERLIQHFVARREMRRTILRSLAYPLFVCVLAVGIILFFILFLLPRLQGLLVSLGGQLPPATRLLVGLSDGLVRYGPIAAIITSIAVATIWQWRRSASGRKQTDQWLLRMPVVGPLTMSATTYNFSQTFAVLLENGVTTAEALRMTEKTIDNTVLQEAFHVAMERVLEGEALSQALVRTQCFPLLVIDQLAVGESTGQLAPSLRSIARDCHDELTHRLRATTQIISTGVLLFAFGFVGFIAYAIVSAVFQVSASFKF
jgi:type II secretory pathway component PulF